jgi:type IV secretion system protein VirB2
VLDYLLNQPKELEMKPIHSTHIHESPIKARALVSAAVFAGLLCLPALAMAQGGNFGGAEEKVTTFFQNINGLLNIASIAVVTIAVIFAGYQIAFAHKRISDVAPILIGGFLIGAAAQIAKMLIGNDAGSGGMAILINALPLLHA